MRISSSHLPSEWLIVSIEKIANKVTDGEHLTPERSESGILLLSARNIQDGFLSLKEVDYVPEAEYKRIIKRCNPEYGDILISCSGTIGRVCIVPQNLKFTLVRSAALIKPGNKIHSNFLGHVLRSSFVQNQISRALNQSAQANLFINHINSLVIPLPPLPEQCKIAEILGAWDESIALLEKLITAKRKLKQGLMQQLLTGKKRFKDFEGSEWNRLTISEVCEVKGGKRLPKGKNLVSENTGYPYIRVTDMYMGGIDTSNIMYVPKTIAPLISKYTISQHDIFISVAGTLGLVGKVPPELDGANLTENADKLTAIKINKDFLLYYLQTSFIQKSIEGIQTQNAQPKIALSRIRDFSILVPSEKEQEKIASVLSAADAEISNLEKQLAAYKQQKRGLMQQLLTGKTRVRVN